MYLTGRLPTNEFLAASDVAYGMGLIAPGLKLSKKRVNQIRHHLLLAHGTALNAIHASDSSAEAGLAENSSFMLPVIETPEHLEAAKKAFREVNAHFLTAVMEGKYLDCYLEKEGADAPDFTDEDMKTIGTPTDFTGLNIYFGKRVRSAPEEPGGYYIFDGEQNRGTGIADFSFEPSTLYWGCRIVNDLWHPGKILISENGQLSMDDRPAPDGQVYDDNRIKILRLNMNSLARAVREDIPVRGYFHWSLTDNLEWHHGFRPRFGLIYINYTTQQRIPKLSAQWFKELIRTGRIS